MKMQNDVAYLTLHLQPSCMYCAREASITSMANFHSCENTVPVPVRHVNGLMDQVSSIVQIGSSAQGPNLWVHGRELGGNPVRASLGVDASFKDNKPISLGNRGLNEKHALDPLPIVQ
jgi:hypothetical protein